MAVYRPLAMLKKTHELKSLSGDVDEMKGKIRACRVEESEMWHGQVGHATKKEVTAALHIS